MEAEGYRVSESKIARILKENGLKAKDGRPGTKRHAESKPTEAQYTEENMIKDKFSINTASYLWCSDITELKYKNGKLYVCGVLDVATRRIVGWSIDRNQGKELVHRAFEMAVKRNPIRPTEAVFHSDRGCQYTAVSTKELVETYGFRKSMSRPGSPHDNQPIESFWHTVPKKFCVNKLPIKHGVLARYNCPFPLVFAELPEVSLVMRAAGVNDEAGFRES